MIITLKDNTVSGRSFSFDTAVGKIGEGRHVDAYLAQYSWPQGTKPVVVKMPKAAGPAENQRIQRQASAPTGGDSLPRVVAVMPIEKADGTEEDCIAVDYIRGITLTRFINGNLKPKFEDTYVNVQNLHNRYRVKRDKVACQIVKGVAAAIKQMHDAGISHEELTADDVIITAEEGVALTGTGQAMSNGQTHNDLYRIGIVAYQLCVANCDLGQVDVGNVASAQMQDFIRKALGREFSDIDEVIVALGKLTTFDHRKARKGLFGGNRKNVLAVDAHQYGVFVPEEPSALQDETLVAVRKPDVEASDTDIPNLHPAGGEAVAEKQDTREEEAEREAARRAAEAKAAEEGAKAEAEAKRIKAEQEAARKAAEAKAEAERVKAEAEGRKAKEEAERQTRLKAQQEIERIKKEAKHREEEAKRREEDIRRKAQKEREARLQAEAEAKKAKAQNSRGENKDKHPAAKSRKMVFGGIAAAAAVLLLAAAVAMRPGNTKTGDGAKTQTVTTEVKEEKTTVPVSNPVKPQTSIPTGGTVNSGDNISPINAVGSKKTGKANVAASKNESKQGDKKQGSKKNKTAITNKKHTNSNKTSKPQQPQEDEVQKKGVDYRLFL